MIKEVIKAVNEVLKTKFPTVERESQSVKEGFSRPSFFSRVDNPQSSHVDPLTVEHSATVRIVYFPSGEDQNDVELTEMADALFDAFSMNLLITAGTLADAQGFTSSTDDGILSASFDISYTEILPDTSEVEMMQELKFK